MMTFTVCDIEAMAIEIESFPMKNGGELWKITIFHGKTMENHHRNSEFFHEKWWIFP